MVKLTPMQEGSGNGILAAVPGSDVARAVQMCPDPKTAERDVHYVALDVEHLGRVAVTCRLQRLKRGRNRLVFWTAAHARTIERPPHRD